jgi:regulator of RNase E activity RraB
VVEALQEQGDNLAKPRPVKHWLYFESYAAREQYIQAVLTRGYQVKQVAHSGEAQRDQPFGLVIERVDRVDWQSIDAVVIELFQLAKSMNGDYDGWETSVEK